MLGDLVYRVWARHRGRVEDMYFGTFATRAEAEVRVAELAAREMHGENWASVHHDLGFEIREHRVDVDFVIPTRPGPRDRYHVRATPVDHGPGRWKSTDVEVVRRSDGQVVAAYRRNYAMLHTFEPFRQGGRELALVAPNYTATSVIDLATGDVVAAEEPSAGGFCPVGFYVPDWWDVNDGTVIPGAVSWRPDHEWPTGQLGFVWGCVWGDDNSWKVQALDLSRVTEGVIRRDARFGYVELETWGWEPPWTQPELAAPSRPPRFIRVRRRGGVETVEFAVRAEFQVADGARVPVEEI